MLTRSTIKFYLKNLIDGETELSTEPSTNGRCCSCCPPSWTGFCIAACCACP
ncbi:unnamed protein product, partial [Brachionus calyciflorus]